MCRDPALAYVQARRGLIWFQLRLSGLQSTLVADASMDKDIRCADTRKGPSRTETYRLQLSRDRPTFVTLSCTDYTERSRNELSLASPGIVTSAGFLRRVAVKVESVCLLRYCKLEGRKGTSPSSVNGDSVDSRSNLRCGAPVYGGEAEVFFQ